MNASMAQPQAFQRGALIRWILATAIGWSVGFAVCEAIHGFLAFLDSLAHCFGGGFGGGLAGVVIGLGVGTAQRIVLPRMPLQTRYWIWASAAGFGIGKGVANGLMGIVPGPAGYFLAGAVIGATAGLAQWLAMKRHDPATASWIITTSLGWAIGWYIGSLLNRILAAPEVIGLALGATLAGVITGLSMLRLLRTPAQDLSLP